MEVVRVDIMSEFTAMDIISYLENELNNFTDFSALFKQIYSNFHQKDCARAYGYILKNSTNSKLLDLTIREVNKTRYFENLENLIDFILRTTNDDLINAKVLAIKTISNYKSTNAVSALMYCLNDKNSNYKIRLASAEALGKIGDRNAFDALTNIVTDEDEKSIYIRESAAVALGMLGDSRALDVFSSILNTKQMFLDKFSYLKEKIVEAMSNLDIAKDKNALSMLKKSLLDKSSRIRISAIETLMNAELEESYDLIYERLKYDDNIEVRKNALVALYNLSDRTILDEILNNDYPRELQAQAMDIIKEYEDNDE